MALVGLAITGIVAIVITPIVKKQSPKPLHFSNKNVSVKTVKFLKFTNLEACTPMPKNAKKNY